MSPFGAKKNLLITLLALLSLASTWNFASRNINSFYEVPIDFLTFVKAAENFTETGELYQRVDNYPDRYHPSAVIYKFPPPYQFNTYPFANIEKTTKAMSVTVMKIFFMVCFVGTGMLLYIQAIKTFQLDDFRKIILASLITITLGNFTPFLEAIRWLIIEIPATLLLFAGFMITTRLPRISGAICAYFACIKLYPVFIFGYYLYRKNIKALQGFIAACLVIGLFSLWLFGWQEHVFYLTHILPVLLNEPVILKNVNMNLEMFFYHLGIIDNITGNIHSITRLAFLVCFVFILYRSYRHLENGAFQLLTFCLFICTMFFCFPNYWPQYQVYMIIPLFTLFAYSLTLPTRPAIVNFVVLAVCVIFLCTPILLWMDTMKEDLAQAGVDQMEALKEASEQGELVTLWKYSKAGVVYYFLYICRALVPLLCWVLLARAILRFDCNQATARVLVTTS
jgi:hypothetical protein